MSSKYTEFIKDLIFFNERLLTIKYDKTWDVWVIQVKFSDTIYQHVYDLGE